jgi:hypothetical protein
MIGHSDAISNDWNCVMAWIPVVIPTMHDTFFAEKVELLDDHLSRRCRMAGVSQQL